jgi:hypothetical protein
MKALKRMLAAALVVMLGQSLVALDANDPGGPPPQGDGSGGQAGRHSGGRGGAGGQRQRPSPEQMAAHLIDKFDANKDGELSLDELTRALEALRKHRAEGAGRGGPGGQAGRHREPPPADKVAAQLIEKYSSDKKGLTQDELAKAIADHVANRGRAATKTK